MLDCTTTLRNPPMLALKLWLGAIIAVPQLCRLPRSLIDTAGSFCYVLVMAPLLPWLSITRHRLRVPRLWILVMHTLIAG
jgi:hypothetical protein